MELFEARYGAPNLSQAPTYGSKILFALEKNLVHLNPFFRCHLMVSHICNIVWDR